MMVSLLGRWSIIYQEGFFIIFMRLFFWRMKMFTYDTARNATVAMVTTTHPLPETVNQEALKTLMDACHIMKGPNQTTFLGSSQSAPLYAARDNLLFARALCLRFYTMPISITIPITLSVSFTLSRDTNGKIEIGCIPSSTSIKGFPKDKTFRELLLHIYDYFLDEELLFIKRFKCQNNFQPIPLQERFNFASYHELQAIDNEYQPEPYGKGDMAITGVEVDRYWCEPITDVTCQLTSVPRDEPYLMLPTASILGTVTILGDNVFKYQPEDISILQRLWRTQRAPKKDAAPVLLESIILPEALEVIGAEAFMNAPLLEEVILPNTLTTIKKRAFFGCSKLKQLVLGPKVKQIEESALQFPGEIILHPENPYFVEENGCLYTADKRTLIRVKTDLEHVLLPETLTSIADGAFAHCTKLRHLTLPKSLTFIGERAFLGCRHLKIANKSTLNCSISNTAVDVV